MYTISDFELASRMSFFLWSSIPDMELIKLARANKKTLMVGHTFEYTAAVNKIREIVKNGDLGDILYVLSLRLNLGLFQPDINVAPPGPGPCSIACCGRSIQRTSPGSRRAPTGSS